MLFTTCFFDVEESCSGCQSLIAWNNVWEPNFFGGLGIKNIRGTLWNLQSGRFYLHPHLFLTRYTFNTQTLLSPPFSNNTLCKIINRHMPTIQNIPFLLTKNGTSSYFRLDIWLPNKTIASSYSNISSHSNDLLVRVANIMCFGLEAKLRNRLTSVASQESDCLLALLRYFMPSDELDAHFLICGYDFSTKNADDNTMREEEVDLDATTFRATQVSNKSRKLQIATFPREPQHPCDFCS